jgi:hypothetical protein
MAGTEMKNVVLIALVVLVILFVVYQYDPTFFGLLGAREGFADVMNAGGAKPSGNAHGSTAFAKPPTAAPGASPGSATQALNGKKGNANVNAVPSGDPQSKNAAGNDLKVQPKAAAEGFADLSAYEGPASFGSAEAPAGCYPRDQLTPSELLPKDMNSIWAEQNPMGPGSLKGKNFLSAGALIGVNTVGQSLRNANLQVRSEPPNPQVPVSIFNQTTISPDISHRPLEIGA